MGYFHFLLANSVFSIPCHLSIIQRVVNMHTEGMQSLSLWLFLLIAGYGLIVKVRYFNRLKCLCQAACYSKFQ